MVLFSGGVDSTLIAALSDISLRKVYDSDIQQKIVIELVNICFDNGRSPDRESAINAY